MRKLGGMDEIGIAPLGTKKKRGEKKKKGEEGGGCESKSDRKGPKEREASYDYDYYYYSTSYSIFFSSS